MNNTDLLNMNPQDLRDRLLQTQDSSEFNDLISIFNLNLKKKEIIRADVLSDLQDKLADQMGRRVENNADTFSNRDLLDYLNTIQSILNKQQKVFDGNQTSPSIAVQNNLIISDATQELDKNSRDRVADLIRNILQQQNDVVEDNIIDTNEQGEHDIV